MHLYLKRALRGAIISPLVLGSGLLLAAGVGQAHAQAAHMTSNLTSTATPQVLQLASDVTLLANGLYRWTFTLSNPIGNSTQNSARSAAGPQCRRCPRAPTTRSPSSRAPYVRPVVAQASMR